MRVAVTGTPGTGKTTAVDAVETDLDVVHLNDIIKSEGLTTSRDDERDTLVVDMDALAKWLDGHDDILFESHLAHQFDADRVVVLRCRPDKLKERLTERGESDSSVAENAESEALDLILSESVNRHGEDAVYEIETTDTDPDDVADAIEAVVAGEREPSAGTVSYVDYL
jgi:adenylate kinase